MINFELPKHSRLQQKSFTFGVATSSFQIEGGAEEREKSIWDTFCEVPGAILDNTNGLVACDHYRLWRDDVARIKSMGFDAYRLSLSWPRIVNADRSVNTKGINFYRQLLTELKNQGIQTYVTLYHWDLPQYLDDKGGWLNRDTAYAFADYAAVVIEQLGDKIDSYATLNEPFCSAHLGYELGVHAPGIKSRKSSRQAAHYLLLAHGLAMKVLKEKSPHTQNGVVLNFTPCYPISATDKDAAETANQYINHWYAKPIFDGEYPAVIDKLDADERPQIEDGDLAIISHPIDFLGVNFYTRLMYEDDGNGWYIEHVNENVPKTDIGWEIFPQALTDILNELNQRYALPPIYITENGAAFHDSPENGKVDDQSRMEYYQSHLNALHNAIEDGVNVQGYFAWSLMDNFEWAEGYSQRFGIVYVNYDTLERITKTSGSAFKALIAARQ